MLTVWQKLIILIILFVLITACAAIVPSQAVPEKSNETGAVTALEERTPAISTPSLDREEQKTLPADATHTDTPAPAPTSMVTETPVPTQTAEEERKTLLDEYMPRHQVAGETEHFIFYTQDDYSPVDQEWWMEQAEIIYDYVSERVVAESDVKISVGFLPAQKQACPIRGLASSDNPPIVLLFADPDASPDYLLAVLAHEVGHAIPAQGYPGELPNDTALTEGLATWASGKYWDTWMGVPSIHFLVKQYIDTGKYLPISENVELSKVYPWQEGAGEDCLARRDQIYSQWGSFVGFLIDQYGWEKVHELFESGYSEKQGDKTIEHPTDYRKVFGKDLSQLESEWLEFIGEETRVTVDAGLYWRFFFKPAVPYPIRLNSM